MGLVRVCVCVCVYVCVFVLAKREFTSSKKDKKDTPFEIMVDVIQTLNTLDI